MKENFSPKEEPHITRKLFSTKHIGFGTYLGGPLAGAYMIGQNFKKLNKTKESKYSIYVGILFTIVLFIAIFLIPENIIDKIPNVLFPAIYTVISYLIARHFFGNLIEKNDNNKNQFHSWWRAAGVGFISFLILIAVLFAFIYFETSDVQYGNYDKQIIEFQNNEEISLEFYQNLNSKPKELLLEELNEISIPMWKENIKMLEELNGQNLPSELSQQNKILLSYSNLRLQAFELIKKSIEEETEEYTYQINQIHSAIDEKLDELN